MAMAVTWAGWVGCAGEDPAPPGQWESQLAVRTGAGFSDNVTLAHLEPESSAFVSAGLEAVASRVAVDTPRWMFLLLADHAQYLSAPSVDQEQSAFGHAEIRQFIGTRLDAGLELDSGYVNEVLDLSTTETNRVAVLAKGQSIGVRPGMSVDLTPGSWTAVEVFASRQWYAAPLDDYWKCGSRLKFVVECGRRGELSVAYEPDRRDYDTEPQLDADGVPEPNTHREIRSHEVSLGWTQPWGEASRWSTTLGCSAEWVMDNGGGFFDSRRFGGSAGMRFRQGGWEAAVDAGASYCEYPVQVVSATDPRHRERTTLHLAVRCGRRLIGRLRATAGYELEQALAVDAFEAYTAQTISGGLEWEF
jgi:hypothetical protein